MSGLGFGLGSGVGVGADSGGVALAPLTAAMTELTMVLIISDIAVNTLAIVMPCSQNKIPILSLSVLSMLSIASIVSLMQLI